MNKQTNLSLLELYNQLVRQQDIYGEKLDRLYDMMSGTLEFPSDVTNTNDFPSLWPDTGMNVYAILSEYNLAETFCTSGILFNIGQGRYKYQFMIVQQDELREEKNGKMYYRYAKATSDTWSGWKRMVYMYELTGGTDDSGTHYKDDFGNDLTDTEDFDPDAIKSNTTEDEFSEMFTIEAGSDDIVVTDEDDHTSESTRLFTKEDKENLSPIDTTASTTSGDDYGNNFEYDGSDITTVNAQTSSNTISFDVEDAEYAKKLKTPRQISLTEVIEGSVYFDGSQDVEIKTSTEKLVPLNIRLGAETTVKTSYRLLCTMPIASNSSSYDYGIITGHVGGFSKTEGKCYFNISISNRDGYYINGTILGSVNSSVLDIVAYNANDTSLRLYLVTNTNKNIDDIKMSIYGSEKMTINNTISTPIGTCVWKLSTDCVRFEGKNIYGNLQGVAANATLAEKANTIKVDTAISKDGYLLASPTASGYNGTFVDTGVKLNTEAGAIVANKIIGRLQGNADTASVATLSNTIRAVENSTKEFYIIGVTGTDTTPYYDKGVKVTATSGKLQTADIYSPNATIDILNSNKITTKTIIADAGTITTINSSTGNITNIKSTNITNSNNITSPYSTITNLTATNITSSYITNKNNITSPNGTITTFSSSTGTITTINSSTISNSGRVTSNYATLSNLTATNETITGGLNFTCTDAITLTSGQKILFNGIPMYGTTSSGLHIQVDGTLSATRVNGAYWNDYAEYFYGGEKTEPGDVIMLDIDAPNEQYIKATEHGKCVVGVHSDSYGFSIGGNKEKQSTEGYIPVGLIGRVATKFVGISDKGAKVVPTYNGCARLYNKETDDISEVIGYLVEADDITDNTTVRRLVIKLNI